MNYRKTRAGSRERERERERERKTPNGVVEELYADVWKKHQS